jgi:hypothetical protein
MFKVKNGADVAERYEIQELHQGSARSAEGMLDGPELRYDSGVARCRDDRRLGDLQPTGIGAVEPPANEVLVVRELHHSRLIGGLLVNCLPIETYHRQILRRGVGFAHERARGLHVLRPDDIVEPTQFEDRQLILERGEHPVGNFWRPTNRLAGYKAWALQQAVMSDLDVDQHRVDAVERRTPSASMFPPACSLLSR